MKESCPFSLSCVFVSLPFVFGCMQRLPFRINKVDLWVQCQSSVISSMLVLCDTDISKDTA